MNYFLSISFILTQIVSLCYFTNAQNSGVKIKVYYPGETENSSPAKSAPKLNPLDKPNRIKWNYTLLSRGVLLFNYERLLSGKLGVEAGLGFTRRDYLFESIILTDNINYRDNGKIYSGAAAEVAVRFYPSMNEDGTGFFMSSGFSFRKYTYPATYVNRYATGGYYGNVTTSSPVTYNLNYNFKDVQLKAGYVYESLWSEEILSEVYFGFGLRYATFAKVSQETNYDVNGNFLSEKYVVKNQNMFLPQFLLGMKMGLPF